ncbi:helix-turn-helix domain-containing protein [Sphingobacterium sp. DN00404]|uniref:Helix-turn-helix domain-containing protein n=1 Tax=Sphingobacterium micropteri TaxID=2763501 RepID=A0ABR7YUK8_9SPHI|nr:helix-turn-helix domain-containing protein [Sphingobacterium micropteri]MBD1434848.1 helix-turn-helix domain-containing protein [Sphingobacterium micropteri]
MSQENNMQISQNHTSRRIVDTKGIMEILDCSQTTLGKLKKRGKIPFMKLGATHRYDVEKVLAALEVNAK